jgi:hypothetical protein
MNGLAPWLHQFRFEWINAHPITKHGAFIEVESHFFSCTPFKIFVFPTHGTLLSQLPYSKKKFPPTPFLYLKDFVFSKLSFFLLSLSLLQWCHHSSPLLMFKEELGVVIGFLRTFRVGIKRHQKSTSSTFFSYTTKFLCIFSLGLDLWDLCFACFQISSMRQRRTC